MARFKARDIVFICGRNLAVVTGKIIEGRFQAGDCVEIPQPPNVRLSNRIIGIEFFYVLGDSGVIGLALQHRNRKGSLETTGSS